MTSENVARATKNAQTRHAIAFGLDLKGIAVRQVKNHAKKAH